MNKHYFFIFVLTCMVFGINSQDLPLEPNNQIKNETSPLDIGFAIYSSGQEALFPQNFCDHILETAPQKIKDVISLLNDSQCPQSILPRKLLLFGPSGSGKSTLARVIAQQVGRRYVFINAGLLGNEYKNSAAQNLRRAVESALGSPVVIIIDEIDTVLRQSKNENNPDIDMPKQVWEVLDICNRFPNVLLICIANDIKNMPEPVQTRFAGDMVEVPLVDSHVIRKKILMFYLQDVLHNCNDNFLNSLVKRTAHFSYRELEKLVANATAIAYLRKSSPYLVSKQDFNIEIARMENSRSLLKKTSWAAYEKYFQYGLQVASLVIGAAGLIKSWKAASEAYDQQERGFTQLAQHFHVLGLKRDQDDSALQHCNENWCHVGIGPVEKFLPGKIYQPIPYYKR